MEDPVDPTRVKSIAERIRAVSASNNPTGIPQPPENRNETDADFPLKNVHPDDAGWFDTIAGNGNGPEL